ncbi:MAG: glutamate-5-semialdehyde dehydrogenase [Clostridia bacterium]|nr:glutamate-5-semialdehyde dehydrogenase [Clostridia bacterium]
MSSVKELAAMAKEASVFLRTVPTEKKNTALNAIADALVSETDRIVSANSDDIKTAEANGMSISMLDRLRLSAERIKGIADSIRYITELDDPVGRVLNRHTRPNGMTITKTAVPMGVIGIIYEARPNVTADAAALCLKAGSAVVLRGGKEAINSNKAIVTVMREAITAAGFPADCICLVSDTSRSSADEMMRLHGLIDLLIPRGGAGLIKAVVENSTVPVIETGVGNCHIYVDSEADVSMAAQLVFNAKCSRPSVCNACETLLVHKDIADKALPAIKQLLDQKQTRIHGCEDTRRILGTDVVPVTEDDYKTEFLDFALAVRVVADFDQAIGHIMQYSSGHSECIVTDNNSTAERFLSCIDAAAVYHNASTRFTDGGEFGLGAEIGISTQKLHARGPMGLEELTSYKYIIRGNGQTR